MNDKKAQTRERILKAASSALIQRGPAEPSVASLFSKERQLELIRRHQGFETALDHPCLHASLAFPG